MKSEKVFLLDIVAGDTCIHLTFLTESGSSFLINRTFKPYFFVGYGANGAELINDLFRNFGKSRFEISVCRKKDLISDEVKVYKIVADTPRLYKKARSFIESSRHSEKADIYNLQLSCEQLFMFDKDIFPFCAFAVETSRSGKRKWVKVDSYEEIDYEIPYLKKMYLEFEDERINPKHFGLEIPLKVRTDDEELLLFDFRQLNDVLRKYDPDVLITKYGDSVILPGLIRNKIELNRFGRRHFVKRGVSFESYGKTYYRDDSVYLFGRIHIDVKNSFFYKEVGLEGIIEVARISSIPVQRLSRTALGTPITSMEMKKAFSDDYLIPYHKNMPEDSKTAYELMKIDKGGLTYRPKTGIFENVCELDFFSMYPSIILNYNLSYETINCNHSDCNTVLPGTEFRVCTKKIGIVPRVLRFLLVRRKRLKIKKFDARQKALKWLLVVSFGYLGYKNAVFGRIESHEATTAIGRLLLITAKEVSEDNGFEFIHGLTDSLWVYKRGATLKDYEKLAETINAVVNEKFPGISAIKIPFQIQVEGVYHWIVFLGGKKDGVGVPNRFYGKFSDGEFKIRGVELRRGDTPIFIKEYQEEVLELLKKANNKEEFLKYCVIAKDIEEKYLKILEKGLVEPYRLVIRKRVSKEPAEYLKSTDISETCATLIHEDVVINPGEKINIIYTDGEKGTPFEIFLKNPRPVNLDLYKKRLKAASEIFNIA